MSPNPSSVPLSDGITLRISRVNLWGSRWIVSDAKGVVLYDLRKSFLQWGFFDPGSDQPRYVLRSKDFWGLRRDLIDASVRYVMATATRRQLFDSLGLEIAVLSPAVPPPSALGDGAQLSKWAKTALECRLDVGGKEVAHYSPDRHGSTVAISVRQDRLARILILTMGIIALDVAYNRKWAK